jgi:hypothetical protein
MTLLPEGLIGDQVADIDDVNAVAPGGGVLEMHGFMVKIKTAGIFKGILETWNSTRNPKNFAESGAKKIWRARVYHPRIYHDGAIGGANGLLASEPGAPEVREELDKELVTARPRQAQQHYAAAPPHQNI